VLVFSAGSSASAIQATRQVMGQVPALRTNGFSVTPRREAITAEGWVRDILSTGQRRLAGAAADEPAGHPLRCTIIINGLCGSVRLQAWTR